MKITIQLELITFVMERRTYSLSIARDGFHKTYFHLAKLIFILQNLVLFCEIYFHFAK